MTISLMRWRICMQAILTAVLLSVNPNHIRLLAALLTETGYHRAHRGIPGRLNLGRACLILDSYVDKRAIFGFTVLIISVGVYNLYLYELLWGTWEKREAKALFYLITAFVLLYLLIEDLTKKGSITNFQITVICKCSLIINFLLFSLILYGSIANPVVYLYILNGSIFVISIMVLISGLRHGIFKNE